MNGRKKFDLADVLITHLKGSGPGGQNRNKRMSGVRIVHIPTGVTVVATERRSQGQNLEAAKERLEEKLFRRSYRPPPRKKTRETKGSVERRLDTKKRHATRKSDRRQKNWD